MEILAQKYPYMLKWKNETNNEIINVAELTDYSDFCKCFSLKIVIRYDSKLYSHGILNHKFSYITKDKFNELSNNIANDPKVKQWIAHINEYHSTLPIRKKSLDINIQHLKDTYPQGKELNDKIIITKKSFKIQEREILKGYIRDWSYVSTLIEHELKINELNKNVQGLESDFENIKNQVNKLEERVMNLENTSNWNCANTASFIAGVVSVGAAVTTPPAIPVIATVGAAIGTVTAGACAIAGL